MRNYIGIVFILSLLFACQTGSNQTEEKVSSTEVTVRGEAQGTTYTVKYISEEIKGIKEKMDSLLREVDVSMSTYVPDSRISRLNEGDTVEIDAMFKAVFELSKEIHQKTDGAFNPTIGPLIKAWGFDYANPEKLDSTKVKELLLSSGFDQFVLNEELKMWKVNEVARINFNAVAQGYSVDLMAKILDDLGLENYYVELGGELKTKGKNRYGDWWVIGIDQPIGENLDRKLANRVSLENAAMATSGNYRKFYEVDGKKYSHTLNPNIGYPAENSLLSATVVAKECAVADAMATAFMVMGVNQTKEFLARNTDLQAHLIFVDANNEYKVFTTEKLKNSLLEN